LQVSFADESVPHSPLRSAQGDYLEDINRLEPGESEVLVRVKAVGVGPWDAWIRAGKSACRSRCR